MKSQFLVMPNQQPGRRYPELPTINCVEVQASKQLLEIAKPGEVRAAVKPASRKALRQFAENAAKHFPKRVNGRVGRKGGYVEHSTEPRGGATLRNPKKYP